MLPLSKQFQCLASLFAISAMILGCSVSSTAPTGTTEGAQQEWDSSTLQAAVRAVAIRTTQSFPDLDDVQSVKTGGYTQYVALVDEYLDSPAFRSAMLDWCRDIVFRFGRNVTDGVDFDDPALLCSYLIVEDGDFRELVTADYKYTTKRCEGRASVHKQSGALVWVLNNAGVLTSVVRTVKLWPRA